MKSKKFLKKAGVFMESFFSGVKEALGIRSPSLPMEKHPEMNAQHQEIAIAEDIRDAAAIRQRAPEEKTPAQEVAQTLRNASLQIGAAGDQVRTLIRILGDIGAELSMIKFDRENTNNWKKMHGIPMRRKSMQERRRKVK